MSKISVLPPSGFRDFPPAEALLRTALIDKITKIYQSHGFQPIATSFVENLSTLQGKGGGSDNEKLIFKILKRGEDLERSLATGKDLADLGLRFDLTLPLARFYAKNRADLPRPFKVFQIGPVWRADRPQKGRYREFFQCDVDIIGANEIGAEYDCILAIQSVFTSLGLEGIEIHLNDRQLLSEAGRVLQIPSDIWAKILVSLDKLDKIESQGVFAEIATYFTLNQEQIKVLDALMHSTGDGAAAYFLAQSEEAALASKNLETLRTLLENSSSCKVIFNPSLVRGQDYYTGTIFELRHPNIAGSLAGGGRYNRLLEVFGAETTPAFGGSIGFERLVLLMQEKGIDPLGSQKPQIFFPLLSANERSAILALAHSLRQLGLRVDVSPDASKLKNQFKYANDRGIPYVAILGESELAAGQVKLKNMATSEETAFSIAEFPARIVALCQNS